VDVVIPLRVDDYIALLTTDERMLCKWIMRRYKQRPGMKQDYQLGLTAEVG